MLKAGRIIKEDNRLRVEPPKDTGALMIIQEISAPGAKVTASVKNDHLDHLEIAAREDGVLRILNTFPTALLALSDDVPTGRFGDFIQKLHDCPVDDYFEIPLMAGRTYQLTYVQ